METYPLNKEMIMSDVLACDAPVRPIKPGHPPPAPPEPAPEARPAPATFSAELGRIFIGLLGR